MSRYTDVPGYNDRKWRKIRDAQLLDSPLCVMCQGTGKITPATIVDHIVPHQGDPERFWDLDNLQSLCKSCHDSHKKAQESGGHLRGCDVNGMPLDQSHWFNRKPSS